MKKSLYSSFIALLLVVGVLVPARGTVSATEPMQTPFVNVGPCPEFTGLRLGSSGERVKALQQYLNRDPETQVNASGVGSMGNESIYFGPATMRALVAFQNKYRAEILNPVGLTRGTGVVGVYTARKLRALLCGGETKEVSVISNVSSPAKVGDKVTITGSNFSRTGNTVVISNANAGTYDSVDGKTITFKLPEGGGHYCPPINGQQTPCILLYHLFSKGDYKLQVATTNGLSNTVDFKITGSGTTVGSDWSWSSDANERKYKDAEWNPISISRLDGLRPAVSEVTDNNCSAGSNTYVRGEGGLCFRGYTFQVISTGKNLDTLKKFVAFFAPVTSENEAMSFVAATQSDLMVEANDLFLVGSTATVFDGFLVKVTKKNTFGCGAHVPNQVIYHVSKAGEVELIAKELIDEPTEGAPILCVD